MQKNDIKNPAIVKEGGNDNGVFYNKSRSLIAWLNFCVNNIQFFFRRPTIGNITFGLSPDGKI